MWLEANEDEILADLMESDDPRIKLAVWQELRRYGYGAPPTRVEINLSGLSPEQMLEEIDGRRRTANRDGRDGAPAEALTSPLSSPFPFLGARGVRRRPRPS